MGRQKWMVFALLCMVIWVATFAIERTQHTALFAAVVLGFGCVVYLSIGGQISLKCMLWAALFVRLPILCAPALLSDDFYRFLWDGLLWIHGYNAYEFSPTDFMLHHPQPWMNGLYAKLNSAEYDTVYPPPLQLLYAAAAWAYEQAGLWAFLLIFRVPMLMADLVTIWALVKILVRKNLPQNRALWYAFSPLVLLEGMGNLHAESLAVTAVMMAVLYYQYHTLKAGAALGLAVLIKLNPLLLLPAFLWPLSWQNRVRFVSIFSAFILLVVALSWQLHPWESIARSTRLYFQYFEFNGSIYKAIRFIGYQLYGFNKIRSWGPLLSAFSALIIVFVSIGYSKKHFSKTLLYAFAIYLALSSIVHPWYTLPLLALGIAAGAYWPIVLSGSIFFSYALYTATGVQDNVWVTIAVYLPPLLTCLMEDRKRLRRMRR